MTLWSAGGLRTILLQLGQVAPASEGVPGAGALFYRNPWELADYKDFGYISHAMEQAVRDSVATYQAQREARRQAACNAWQNSCISALEESHTCPARGPRQRGLATPPRMGVPMPGKFSGIAWSKGYGSNQNQSGSGYAGLLSSWYLTRRDMWVPNAVGGIHTRIEFR